MELYPKRITNKLLLLPEITLTDQLFFQEDTRLGDGSGGGSRSVECKPQPLATAATPE